MSYIEKSLTKDEKIVENFKYHSFVWVLTWFYILIFIVAAIPTFGITLLVSIYIFFRTKSVEQGLTTKRVIRKTGVISRKTDEMKITAIETVEMNQGVFGRIFGYGFVKITGRGTSNLVLSYVRKPLDVKKRIEEMAD